MNKSPPEQGSLYLPEKKQE